MAGVTRAARWHGILASRPSAYSDGADRSASRPAPLLMAAVLLVSRRWLRSSSAGSP